MEKRGYPIGFTVKQINNIYEKDLNENLKQLGITASQCAVLGFLLHTNKEEVNQRDVERGLSLKNPDGDGTFEAAGRERFYFLCAEYGG